jgi:hypothetical protein
LIRLPTVSSTSFWIADFRQKMGNASSPIAQAAVFFYPSLNCPALKTGTIFWQWQGKKMHSDRRGLTCALFEQGPYQAAQRICHDFKISVPVSPFSRQYSRFPFVFPGRQPAYPPWFLSDVWGIDRNDRSFHRITTFKCRSHNTADLSNMLKQ